VLVGVAAVALVGVVAVAARPGPGDPARADVRTDLPAGAAVSGRWAMVPKESAGLGEHSDLDGLVVTDDAWVAAGQDATPAHSTMIWRSTDGFGWEAVPVPDPAVDLTALAAHGDEVVAVGAARGTGERLVWRSGDGGRTWREVVRDAELFGRPDPKTGRPNVGSLLWSEGTWFAGGGADHGWQGLWRSRDLRRWTDVPMRRSAGSVTVLPGHDGRLAAYWVDARWTAATADGWPEEPEPLALPADLYLAEVAPGEAVAVGDRWSVHGQPTPLLRSADGGATWRIDPTFLDAFPGALAQHVTTTGSRTIAMGFTDAASQPGAWVSTDGPTWEALPAALRGAPGGALSLAAAVGGRTVIAGSAPELDRYYLLLS
jgi:hypothetical protein